MDDKCPCCSNETQNCQCASSCGCGCPADKVSGFLEDGVQLWTLHIALTRAYIMEAVNRLPSAATTLKLLLKNQHDLGHHYDRAYPGQGKMFAELLVTHIKQAGGIVAKAVKGADVKRAVAEWRKNGDDIVAFLSKNDEELDAEKMAELWTMHLDMTIQEATNIIKHKDSKSAKDFTQLISHGREMADVILSAAVRHVE